MQIVEVQVHLEITSNNVFNFVANNTDIYQLDGGTFTSRKGSLTGGNTDYFTFTQFGQIHCC